MSIRVAGVNLKRLFPRCHLRFVAAFATGLPAPETDPAARRNILSPALKVRIRLHLARVSESRVTCPAALTSTVGPLQEQLKGRHPIRVGPRAESFELFAGVAPLFFG